MSAQLPPNPILTTYQYWNWVNVDEATRRQRALDNNYMMFPTAQNYPTFFSKLFLITDAVLTKMANTSYVYSLIQALLSATTWTGSNQLNSIKVNTLANITLNDANFAGTTTLTNSTFNDAFTPTYSYPIGTATGLNTPSIGTAGRIGFIPATTFITNTAGEGFGGGGISLRSVSLTAGTWVIYGFWKKPVNTYINNSVIVLSTVQNNSSLDEVGRKGTQNKGTGTASNLVQGQTTMGVVSLTTTKTFYLNCRSVFANSTLEGSTLIAIRIG
jgi:hypothetical protein